MNDIYERLLRTADEAIKAGRVHEVPPLFANLNLARMPRKWRQALAKVCRRAGLAATGLRILQPIVHATKKDAAPARSGEIAEYAVLLSRIGARQEALRLLARVNPTEAPEALLYQGFCHVSGWEYDLALGYFERHLATVEDPYARLITRVNLAACYVELGARELALSFLNETIELASVAGASRLLGNCLELRGQVNLQREDFNASRVDLEKASKILDQSQSADQLLIRKWSAVLAAEETNSVAPLLAFRTEAESRRDGETCRDADFLILKRQYDEALFHQLVFGTPHLAYRRRVIHALNRIPPASIVRGPPTGPRVDLRGGETNCAGAPEALRRALEALSADAYTPRSMGALFDEIYPGEYFDVVSSPLRIRQVFRRARRWIEERDLPLRIVSSTGGYRLLLEGEVGLHVSLGRTADSTLRLARDRLVVHFGARAFNASDARAVLGLSASAFHRFARSALDEGLIRREGAGKATRYTIAAQAG